MQGKVKMFDTTRGFGFIEGDDEQDYFCHYSNIVMDGYKTLEKGETVIFDIEQAEKGPQAINVTITENGGVK